VNVGAIRGPEGLLAVDPSIERFSAFCSRPMEPGFTMAMSNLQAGAVLGIERWRVTVTMVDRSREFVGQHGHQRYASLSISRHR